MENPEILNRLDLIDRKLASIDTRLKAIEQWIAWGHQQVIQAKARMSKALKWADRLMN